MQVKTSVKAGGIGVNHNQTAAPGSGLAVKTRVKAGGLRINHVQTVAKSSTL